MRKIILVTCVAPKRKIKSPAKDLYQGNLFEKLMKFAAAQNPIAIFILSGKHHLLDLDTEIEPYDVNLNKVSEVELKNWSMKVLDQLRTKGCNLKEDYFYILTNDVYRKYLVKEIKHFEVPFHIE